MLRTSPEIYEHLRVSGLLDDLFFPFLFSYVQGGVSPITPPRHAYDYVVSCSESVSD